MRIGEMMMNRMNLDFIMNYDIKYGMGQDAEGTDE
jgi:hypothetical protein